MQWQPAFTLENARQAILAFRGDVYTGLDADSLSAADFQYAQQHLRILSGLYGVLRPLDLLPALPFRNGYQTFDNPAGANLMSSGVSRLLTHSISV